MCPQDSPQDRHEILQSIQDLDNKISSLTQQKQQLLRKLKSTPLDNLTVNISEDFTLDKNVRIFKELFRGRTDVYAKHWTSRKTGKSGYSPVCKNEWIPNICQRSTVRCSKCSNREFLPFDESVILKHLNGSTIAGIYPLQDGDTCYFLAVDFDGSTPLTINPERSRRIDKEVWQDNIIAFKQTCYENDVPVAIERSRS